MSGEREAVARPDYVSAEPPSVAMVAEAFADLQRFLRRYDQSRGKGGYPSANERCSVAVLLSALHHASPSDRIERLEAAKAEAEKRGMAAGMVIAAQMVFDIWGDDTAAKEILGAAGVTSAAEGRRLGCDDYDLRKLVPVFRQFARERKRRARSALQPKESA